MRRPLAAFGLIVLIVLIILSRGCSDNIDYYNRISSFEGGNVMLTGKVANVEIKNNNQVLYLTGVSSNDAGFPIDKNIGVICYLKDYEDITLGSFVMVSGEVNLFNTATNEGEFDLREYYLSLGYYFALYNSKLESVISTGNIFYCGLDKAKKNFSLVADNIFFENDAGVVKAMLLGEKGSLDQDIKTLYQKSGISHILAISGLHISLIGIFIYSVLKKMKINIAARCLIPSVVMIIYGIMTGLGVSTFRAVCMFLLLMMSFLLRRTYDLPTGLIIAAIIIILSNPYACLSSTFYLSFVAVAGVAIFSRSMIIKEGDISGSKLNKVWDTFVTKHIKVKNKSENKFVKVWDTFVTKHVKPKNTSGNKPIKDGNKIVVKIINILITGLSINYFTLPLILYYYYEYPLYSVFLNLLVVPLMSVMLGFAIVSITVGVFNTFAGGLVAIPCHYILAFYEMLCNVSKHLPFNHLILGKPSLIRVVIFYALMGFIILLDNAENVNFTKKYGERLVRKIKLLIKLVVIITGLLLMIKPASNFKVSMLDVGQGDGILISVNGVNCMVDGGSSSKKELGKYILTPFLKASGVSKIDYWLISHPDSDHTSGLIEMLNGENNIKIEMILLPDTTSIRSEASDIIELALSQNIPVQYVSRGDRITTDDFEIYFINPDSNKNYTDVNTYSEVFLLTYKDSKILFTGDADTDSERDYIEFCKEMGIDISEIDIFKVPHHGSSTSSGQELINAIKPLNSLISSGKNNRYGHPTEEVLERIDNSGSSIFNTQQSGQISVIYKNNVFEILEFIKKNEE